MRTDWQQLLDTVATAWPADRWSDVGVVVGCSGGADSVALLRALIHWRNAQRAARGFLIVAHYNHGLRAASSQGDETFVTELADHWGLRSVTARADGERRADEASLRHARSAFLLKEAKAFGARYVAVGHSADDNIETFLHHTLRGSGPAGLTGIAPFRSMPVQAPEPQGSGSQDESQLAQHDIVLARPLLQVRRNLIRRALQSIGEDWREDRSNQETAYRRNWLRHELIPHIQTRYPRADEAILRLIDSQRHWRDVIDRLAQQWLDRQADHSRRVVGQATIERDGEIDEAVLVAALQILWSEKTWPRQSMRSQHWRRLATTVRKNQAEDYTLPGQIHVVAEANGAVRLIELPSGSKPTTSL